MLCEEIMTRNPATVPIHATVLEAARLMAERDVGFLPLLDQSGSVVGTVTDRDIVVRCLAKGIDPRTARLQDFGGNELVCCTSDDEVTKAEDLMAEHHVQRIVICDGDHSHGHRPVGVISLQDLSDVDRGEIGETVKRMKEQSAHHAVH